jgi:hypothetical protein
MQMHSALAVLPAKTSKPPRTYPRAGASSVALTAASTQYVYSEITPRFVR